MRWHAVWCGGPMLRGPPRGHYFVGMNSACEPLTVSHSHNVYNRRGLTHPLTVEVFYLTVMKGGRHVQVLSLKNRAGKLDPELQAVVQAIWQLERRIFPKHESLCSNVLQEVQRRNCCVLYALGDVPGKADGVLVGYLMFSCASLVASVTKLAVRENCRRSGYGEALLRTAIEHIRQRKLHCVNLHVDTTREPAIALYKKLGFKVDAVVHSYYAPNRDAFRMALSVDDLASPT